jgi:4-hydroxybenzoate polyprenyltransferase
MAGLMDVEPASHHVCLLAYPAAICHTAGRPQHIAQALAYSMLYNFLRESLYDARDIEEDKRDGVSTLATYLGMSSTIALLLAAAVAGEAWISGAVTLEGNIRAVGMVGLSSWIVTTQAREKRWPWVFFSLVSLLPAWHAQAQLSSGGLITHSIII